MFPTAMQRGGADRHRAQVLPSLRLLRATLAEKSMAFADIVKIGRTHLQDATPLTLGQEFSGYVAQLDHAETILHASQKALGELAAGGTAVGTGLNTHPEFAVRIAAELSRATGLGLPARPQVRALAGHDAMVAAHGALRPWRLH